MRDKFAKFVVVVWGFTFGGEMADRFSFNVHKITVN